MKDYYALFQGEVMTKNFLRSFQCNFNQTWYKTNERYYKNSKNTSINDNSGTTWIYFLSKNDRPSTDATMPTQLDTKHSWANRIKVWSNHKEFKNFFLKPLTDKAHFAEAQCSFGIPSRVSSGALGLNLCSIWKSQAKSSWRTFVM